jgi:hypothetical protein
MGLAALLLPLAFVAGVVDFPLGASAGYSHSPPVTVSSACQMVLDLWCNTDAPCVDVITRDEFALPLVARFDLQKAGIWRCYSPSALDKNLSHYTGGKAFCSHKALADVLAVCDGSKPGPYPLPPAPEGTGGGPGAGCASPFLAGTTNATRPLDNARDKTEYRIPVVQAIPGTQVVVALAENRGGGSGDSGRHQLAMARSTDHGATFAPVVNIYNDSATTVDGLNLGGAVWDNKQKRLSVLFNECFHLNAVGRGGCGAVGQTLQIDTTDNGLTWSAVINHTASLVAQGIKQLNPGPGTGVQLQYQKDTTKNGRLLMPGWGSKTSDPRGTSTRAIVLVAEASPDATLGTAGNDEPMTWQAILVPPEKPENVPNELQCAELSDGTIVLNVRSGNHKLRLLSTSTDVRGAPVCWFTCISTMASTSHVVRAN